MQALFAVYVVSTQVGSIEGPYLKVAKDSETAKLKILSHMPTVVDNLDEYDIVIVRLGDVREPNKKDKKD